MAVVVKEVGRLVDAQPIAVSLVFAGANRRKFKVVKFDKRLEDDAVPKKIEKVLIAPSPEDGVITPPQDAAPAPSTEETLIEKVLARLGSLLRGEKVQKGTVDPTSFKSMLAARTAGKVEKAGFTSFDSAMSNREFLAEKFWDGVWTIQEVLLNIVVDEDIPQKEKATRAEKAIGEFMVFIVEGLRSADSATQEKMKTLATKMSESLKTISVLNISPGTATGEHPHEEDTMNPEQFDKLLNAFGEMREEFKSVGERIGSIEKLTVNKDDNPNPTPGGKPAETPAGDTPPADAPAADAPATPPADTAPAPAPDAAAAPPATPQPMNQETAEKIDANLTKMLTEMGEQKTSLAALDGRLKTIENSPIGGPQRPEDDDPANPPREKVEKGVFQSLFENMKTIGADGQAQ